MLRLRYLKNPKIGLINTLNRAIFVRQLAQRAYPAWPSSSLLSFAA
jgi:hypothetical protein